MMQGMRGKKGIERHPAADQDYLFLFRMVHLAPSEKEGIAWLRRALKWPALFAAEEVALAALVSAEPVFKPAVEKRILKAFDAGIKELRQVEANAPASWLKKALDDADMTEVYPFNFKDHDDDAR